jgi:25S rRNA (uracil2843-N3)-methyltransferase
MGQFDRKAQSQPKHGKPSSSGASKAAPRPNGGTPEWKGPGYIPKKKSTAKPTASSAQEPLKLEPTLPLELEQRMLEVFRATFPASSDFEGLKPTLYKVNDALLRRDLDAAFAEEAHLEAYAIRWSPSRALGYAQLLAWICAEKEDDACIQQLVGSVPSQSAAKVVCFGGGAAEIMAFSGLLRYLRPSEAAGRPNSPTTEEVSDSLEAPKVSATTTTTDLATHLLLRLSHLDIVDWISVLSRLEQGLHTPPVLSKYASATARATNASFLEPGIVEHAFTRTDILRSSTEELRATIGPAPALLTLMSTLNDLYTTSMPRTTAFLKKVTEAAPTGSLLLVVDTPGAHTEVTASNAEGEEEKRKYPMNLLLDFALVPKQKKTTGRKDGDDEELRPKWEKLLEKTSMSYKLREGLRYPGSLENLRFQVHLFRRL